MVKISDVVREMDMQSDTITVYMNRRTGEFVGVTDEDEIALEGDVADDDLPEWHPAVPGVSGWGVAALLAIFLIVISFALWRRRPRTR